LYTHEEHASKCQKSQLLEILFCRSHLCFSTRLMR